MAKLIVHRGSESREYVLEAVTTIGRHPDNVVQISEPSASRSHARISRTPKGFLLEDLKSANGTDVNGRKVEQHVLSHGDTIQIGGTRFIFEEEIDSARPGQPSVLSHLDATVQGKLPEVDKVAAGVPRPAAPKLVITPEVTPIAPPPAPPAAPVAAAPPPPPPPAPSIAAAPPSYAPPTPAAPRPPIVETPPLPVPRPSPSAPVASAGAARVGAQGYGGFWMRFLAQVIDGFLLGIPMGIVGFLVQFLFMRKMMRGGEPSPLFFIVMFGMYGIFGLVGVLYQVVFESSSMQGTLGKKILGLKVTDLEGRRIKIGRALGRTFSKVISGIPCYIGFILAGFTQKKQGLHDMIAKTLVVKKGFTAPFVSAGAAAGAAAAMASKPAPPPASYPPRPAPAAPPRPADKPPAASAGAAEAPRCGKCQAPLKPGAKFCAVCGTPAVTEQMASQPLCPVCGKPNRPGAKFCGTCGQTMA